MTAVTVDSQTCIIPNHICWVSVALGHLKVLIRFAASFQGGIMRR